MTRQQLEIFLATARNLNFTKTANEFFTSQPTISRQISLLEEEWGFKLFLRNKRECQLTPAGLIMYDKCKSAISIIDEGLAKSKESLSGTSGKIRIGALETLDSFTFITPAAAYFHKNFPNTSLNIEKRSFGELREKLNSGYFDVIFTLDFDLKYMDDIMSNHYYDLTAGILMSRMHPLANKEFLSTGDLENETFLLPCPEDTPGRKEELEEVLNKSGLKFKEILYRDNADSVTLNIRAGNGVALLDNSLDAVSDISHYKFFPLKKDHAPLSLIYAWKKQNLNPALEQFINILDQEEVKNLLRI